jgi:PAS domain S-box-containing protein
VDRIEAETKRNRFFTLALDLLGIGDFSGRLLQVNPTWQTVLGYTEDELKAGPAIELVHPDDRGEVAQRVELLMKGLPVEYFEIRCRHKDGSYRWIGWTAASFPEEKLIYVFGRDVTRRRAAEDEVTVLNAELTRRISDLTDINKELESFCYSISHDLRAPLRSIASFTQVVLNQYNGSLAGEGHDYLRRVESAAKYMDRLLMDLLEYSRLGRAEMKLDAVDLESAVTDVLSSIHGEIQTRKAQVDIRRPLGSVVAHSATVRQILFNLIANGLKFVAAEKNPSIRVWTEPQSDCLRIWVADDGIGIAPQFHKKIFGLFQKLHSQKIYPGTGVGLAMVQKGVERMGGRIGVESDLGKGSRFWFELRTANDLPPQASSTTPELQPAQAD